MTTEPPGLSRALPVIDASAHVVEADLGLVGSESPVLDTFLIEHGRIAHLHSAPLSA